MAHLTTEQRYTIWCMEKEGFSQVQIGEAIDKDKSVICRELKRNCDARNGSYRYELAIKKHAQRQKEKHKYIRFTDTVKEEFEALLRKDYSPEQIVGTLKKEGKATMSVERYYQHIWQDKRVGVHYTRT